MAAVQKGWGVGYGTTGTPNKYTNTNTEIARTQAVIQNRINAGLDTTAQQQHYKNLTGSNYTMPKTTNTFDQEAYLKQQQDGVNGIYDQMKQAQLAAAQAARQKAINGIDYQKSLVAPQYQASRNQADVTNAQSTQKLREMMAANGLQASGENVTATVGLQSARQKSLNDLNLQEQQVMNDYDRQITDLNDPSNDLAMIADIESRRAQALYDASIRADDTAYNRGRDALSDSRYDKEWEYQTSRDKVSDSQWDKTFDYQKSRDNMADNQWRQELLWQKKQFASDDAWRKYTFSHMSATDKKQMELNQKQFGEEMAWKMYETQYNGNIELSKNQAAINGYTNASVGSTASTGVTGTAAKGTESFNKNMAAAVATGKVNSAWVPILTEIVKRESSFNPTAKNPTSTAYGYGQFLKSTRAQYEKKTGLSYDNPVNQLIMMAEYVKDRYKTPENALAFWNKNHWY